MRPNRDPSRSPTPLPPGFAGKGPRPGDPVPKRFADRYRDGQLMDVAKGDIARKLKFDDQFRMLHQGDVARRMDLAKPLPGVVHVPYSAHFDHGHVIPPTHFHAGYHGRVHDSFSRGCFAGIYCGPGYFPVVTWYPHWNPWVDWCWHYHCHVFWDPRPHFCRPVIYEPCPVWVYEEPLPCTPLPVVACGTWVDLKPVVVEEGNDVQLVAVRFVDPGHPEENLGPRYRVWFRNNGTRAITSSFNVVAMASMDEQLAAGLPQAGLRVTSIEAGDTQSVDIRLPVGSLSMGLDAEGNPEPFRRLHVLVDANRELRDVRPENNSTQVARGEILPVDPAAFEVQPREAWAGAEVIIAGEGFGPAPGRVVAHVAGQELDAEILGWCDLGVRVNLPGVAQGEAVKAELVVVRGDGAVGNPVPVTIQPANRY